MTRLVIKILTKKEVNHMTRPNDINSLKRERKSHGEPRVIQILFSSSLGIKNQFSSPGQPQANGQTKVTNQTLLKIIKVLLEGAKG